MATILVLEDDELLRTVLVETLRDEDFEVSPAAGSFEALALVEKSNFELIISDVRMEGMDGLDCLAKIREVRPQSRSIVITGYASENAPGRAIGLEADEYLYKPIDLGDLLTAVERVLSSKEESVRYTSLLQPLLSRLRNFKLKSEPSLEATRTRAFRAFYVGVRSGSLNKRQAAASWSHLNILEIRRQSGETPEVLRKGFESVGNQLIAAALQNYQLVQIQKGAITPSHFDGLYQRIKTGLISIEQLKTASTLYKIRNKLESSPPVKAMFDCIWGQLSVSQS